MPLGNAYETIVLNQIFGNAVGCIRSTITAPQLTTTTINVGLTSTGGVSGGLDTAIPANGFFLIGTPGTGTTQNSYTNVDCIFTSAGAAAAATTIAIPSQTIGTSRAPGDFIFNLGTTSSFANMIFPNTLYVGLSTTAFSPTPTDAAILAGEPTATNNYARTAVLNNRTSFPLASGTPAVIGCAVPVIIPAAGSSSGAWASGANFAIGFIADSSVVGGGHVIAFGALSPSTDSVGAATGTMSFLANGITFTLV